MKNQYYFRYNADPNEIKEEESLNLTSAIWFAWGVLLNSGQIFRASSIYARHCFLWHQESFVTRQKGKDDNNEMLRPFIIIHSPSNKIFLHQELARARLEASPPGCWAWCGRASL